MRKLLIAVVCGTGFALAATAFVTPADARRGGGFHMRGHAMGHAHPGRAYRNVTRNRAVSRNVNRNVARNVNRNVTRNVNRNVNRRYVYRNGRWGYWRNGVWIAVAPAVAGATYVASCAYEYNRWQATGSSYWRDRYYNCAN